MPSGHQLCSREKRAARQDVGDVSLDDRVPVDVQEILPACAQSCLSRHISQDYTCPDNDFACLCSEYSSEGFVLGEYAYLCLRTNCPKFTQREANAAYGICSSKSNAVPAEHKTLTIPPAPTTTVSTNTRTSISTTIVATSLSSSAHFISTAQPASSKTSSSTIASLDSSPGSASPTSISADNTVLNGAQVVGISIGAVAVVVIIIAAAWLFIYQKRRKISEQRTERHSYDFIDDASQSLPSLHQGSANAQGPFGWVVPPQSELSAARRKTEWPSQYDDRSRLLRPPYPDNVNSGDDSGRGLYAETLTPPASNRSDHTIRTTSQLLPEKPEALTLKQSNEPPKYLMSPPSMSREERNPAVPAYPFSGLSANTMSSQRPIKSQYPGPWNKSRNEARQPALALQIPKQAIRFNSVEYAGALPPPQLSALKLSEAESRLSERSQAQSSTNSVLNYYAGDYNDSPELNDPTPIDEEVQIRRPPPAFIMVTKPTFPPQAVRGSMLSDRSNRTSFESINSDEPTPPEEEGEEEEKRLTPVAESPIAAIRYPKIPRSSNQAVPRSPVYNGSPRKTDQAEVRGPHRTYRPYRPQQDPFVERSQGRTEQPTSARYYRSTGPSSHGQISKPNNNGPHWPLRLNLTQDLVPRPLSVRSPAWEQPKLTPRREGDDLYLDLSLASPVNGNFTGGY